MKLKQGSLLVGVTLKFFCLFGPSKGTRTMMIEGFFTQWCVILGWNNLKLVLKSNSMFFWFFSLFPHCGSQPIYMPTCAARNNTSLANSIITITLSASWYADILNPIIITNLEPHNSSTLHIGLLAIGNNW